MNIFVGNETIFFQIDILVNNAGRSQRSLIDQTPIEVDKGLFDIDVFAPISLTKTVLPHMVSRKQGHFFVTSSVAGKLGKCSFLYFSEKNILIHF